MIQEINGAMQTIADRKRNCSVLPDESRVTIVKALKTAANYLDLGDQPSEGV